VLRIGFAEPGSLSQVQRILDSRNTSTVFVEVQRGRRRWGAMLRPAGS